MKKYIPVIVCIVCLFTPSVHGAPASDEYLTRAPLYHPDDIFWERGPNVMGLDGTVKALTIYDGLTVVGGAFTVAGDTTAYRIAAWDGSSWSPLGSGVDNEVSALIVYDGKLIAGGKFTTGGGVTANRIAAWNGSSWSPLSSGVNNEVLALAVYDGKLIAGGKFTTAGGVVAYRIAAWDGAAWDSLGSGTGGTVKALTTCGDVLIAGGTFSIAGGISANNIAAWNGSDWSPLGAGLNNDVLALTVCNDTLIAGGFFTTAGGTPANRIAAWDGTSWGSIGTGFDYWVTSLTVHDGALTAGSRGGVKAWNGAAWTFVGSEFDSSADIFALLSHESTLIAGGNFHSAGDIPANMIAAWDGAAWSSLGTGSNSNIRAMTVYNNLLIAGGSFGIIDGVAANRIAAWDGSSWTPLGSGVNGVIHALTVFSGLLIAGGEFDTAGGVSAQRVAAWNGSSWFSMGLQTNYIATSLTVFDGELITGTKSGNDHGLIRAWNGSWHILGDLEPAYNVLDIDALTVFNNRLIAAGTFSRINGVQVSSIAAWDGVSWSPLGGSMWMIRALEVYDGKLFVGGNWGNVSYWDGSKWTYLWSDYGEYDAGLSFTVYNDKLIMGGSYNGDPGNNISAWDGSTWSPLGSGVNGGVNALSVYNEKLMAGGFFTTAGNKISAYSAQWTKPSSTAVMITGFDASPAENGVALSWSLGANEPIEGFRIYRSQCGNEAERLLNERLIGASERRYIDETALPGELYRYTLGVVGAGSGEIRSFPVEAGLAPPALALFQNHPNPFNPSTTIRFRIPHACRVTVTVYSPSGRQIRTLLDEPAPAGTGEVIWDGTNGEGVPVSSGMYFYRLCADKTTLSKKMLLLR